MYLLLFDVYEYFRISLEPQIIFLTKFEANGEHFCLFFSIYYVTEALSTNMEQCPQQFMKYIIITFSPMALRWAEYQGSSEAGKVPHLNFCWICLPDMLFFATKKA